MTLPPSALKDLIARCDSAEAIYETLYSHDCFLHSRIRDKSELITAIERVMEETIPQNTAGPCAQDRVLLMLMQSNCLNKKGQVLFRQIRSWE